MKKKVFTRPVCIMLSQKMYEDISKISDQDEISVSDYIRAALREKFKNEKAPMIIRKED